MDDIQPIEIAVGEHIILYNNGTVVDGKVSGWMVAGGEVVHIFIDNIEQAFRLKGENPWIALREGEADGEV